jgi:GH25 family lysozyme M1 (1,4-beta-N-acetylmuramidase)
MERHGYWVGIYASRSAIEAYISADVQFRYSIWAAEWGDKLRYHGTAAMWQKSEKGRVPGIIGNVDLDECYVDFPSIMVADGLNGFPKPEMEPADVVRLPYIHGMNAGDVQTYIKWVTCLGAGDYQDTAEDFARYLSENA